MKDNSSFSSTPNTNLYPLNPPFPLPKLPSILLSPRSYPTHSHSQTRLQAFNAGVGTAFAAFPFHVTCILLHVAIWLQSIGIGLPCCTIGARAVRPGLQWIVPVLVTEAAWRQLALAGSSFGGLGGACEDVVDLVDVVGMRISAGFGVGRGHWAGVAGGEEGGFRVGGEMAGLGVDEGEKGEKGEGEG